MADLRRDDRGQIILVAAFALAIIFVAMALIVNSAIFTENLASRGETTGSNGALSMRAMVETNVGDAVAAANRYDNGSTTDLTDAVKADIRNISDQTGRQAARSGRVVDVEYDSSTPGEQVYQSDGTTFETDSGSDSYTVAEDVSRVTDGNGTRAFVIGASSISASDNNSAFTVRVQDSSATTGNGNSWRARIWVNSTSDDIHVRTLKKDSGGTVTEDCEVANSSSSVQIDVTGGTIEGEECDALTTGPDGENFHFGAGATDEYDISFENADNIEGYFSMVVRDDGGLNLPSLDTDIQSSPAALYDVTVNYTYVTTDLHYETEIRVAPGEPDV